MTLLNIGGLCLLAAIPLLVIIYIIRRPYRERAVGSAYLWQMSRKYLKKRHPLRRFPVVLSFILQLILLALTAVTAARPAIPLGTASSHVVIIDASASMRLESEGVTRFGRAAADAIRTAESGLCTSMTVILASDTPACLVRDGTPAEAAEALRSAECGWGSCDVYEAVRLAREACGTFGTTNVTFYTDTDYASVENVTLRDMRAGEVNVAVTGLSRLAGRFTGTVTSYGGDRTVPLALSCDGQIIGRRTVSCPDGVPVTVTFDADASAFDTAVLSADVSDALAVDNECVLIGRPAAQADVLICGTDTMFLEAGLEALGGCTVTVREAYDPAEDGAYDLTFLCGCVPASGLSMPTAGVVIGFIQAGEGVSSAASIQGRYRPAEGYASLTEPDPLFKGMEDAVRGVTARTVFYGAAPGWTPVGHFGDGVLPFCVTRPIEGHGVQYLFTFELSESNLVLTPAFMQLLRNAVDTAAPPLIDGRRFTVGEPVTLTLAPEDGCPVVTDEEGRAMTLSADEPVFVPEAVGVYTAACPEGSGRTASFCAVIPESEYTLSSEDQVSLLPASVWAKEERVTRPVVPYTACVLLLLLLIEWGYCCRVER